MNPNILNLSEKIIDTTAQGEAAAVSHGSQDSESGVIFFIFFSLCLGGIVKEINKKTSIPYTPMIFTIGCIFGKYKDYLGILQDPIEKMSNIDGHGLLMIFLPVLIFEAGFSCDWHLFRRQFVQIFVLAFPAVGVSAMLLAFTLKVILGYGDDYYTWTGALLFGSILSCTDTVAVLALLKECGSPKKFNSLIEGESLLNDGASMILFQIFSALMKGKAASLGSAVGLFFSLTIGGMVLGLIFGAVSTLWIKKIFNDEILVVNITFLTCYIMFFIAENVNLGIHISGIISLVTLGLFMSAFGKTRISSEADHAVHAFWKYAVFCAETVIFVLAGILVGSEVLGSEGLALLETADYFKTIALYLCMLVVRFCSISLFMPFVKNIGYGIKWNEVVVLAYGGLRGAIGIAFALIVKNDVEFPDKFRMIVLFHMAGAAVLTLLINGTTTGILVKKIGMITTTKIKQKYQIQFTQKLMEELDEKIDEIKNDRFLNIVNWDKVKTFNCVELYHKYIESIEESMKEEQRSEREKDKNKNDSEDDSRRDIELSLVKSSMKSDLDGDLDEEAVIDARSKYILALKGVYWELFEINQISGDSLILLVESANFDLDNAQSLMNSWEFISNGLINKSYMNLLFKLKYAAVIGGFARNLLFNHISHAYDVVIGYIISLEKAEYIFKHFPIDERIINEIVKESADNREAAESYLHHYLTVSFPEITEQVQNKKASTTLLEQQKATLNENLKTGQIEEREYVFFKKTIDNSVKTLTNMVPDWHMPPIKEFLKNVPFFKYFDDKSLAILLATSEELNFNADAKIIKEYDKATHIFVITRGVGMESSAKGSYQEKKSVGAIFSPIHLIQEGFRYQTTFNTESLVYCNSFKITEIQKIIKNNDELHEYVWKESIKMYIKMFPDDLKPLPSLDHDDFNGLLMDAKLSKYKQGQVIDFTSGGILLKGVAYEKNDKSPSSIQPQEEIISPHPPSIHITQAEENMEPIREEEEEKEGKPLVDSNTKEGKPQIETHSLIHSPVHDNNSLRPDSILRSSKNIYNNPNIINDNESDHEEKNRVLEHLVCVVPSVHHQYFVAQKFTLILHFMKNEETERVFNERKQLKGWKGSMISKSQFKPSMKRSMRFAPLPKKEN